MLLSVDIMYSHSANHIIIFIAIDFRCRGRGDSEKARSEVGLRGCAS